jgi:hypothetical protein
VVSSSLDCGFDKGERIQERLNDFGDGSLECCGLVVTSKKSIENLLTIISANFDGNDQ